LAPGEHSRRLDSGCNLLIRRFTPELPNISELRSDGNDAIAVASSEDREIVAEEIKLDLIEPLEAQQRKPPSSRSGWLRITAANADATLDPVRVGNFFHSLMEILPSDPAQLTDEMMTTIAAASDERLVQPDDLAKLVREGRRLLKIYTQSELYEVVKSAQHVSRELPYHKLANDELEIGRPDLLIKSKQGRWLIVDHKTDTFTAEEIEQHARRHFPQLKTYRDDLQSIANISAEIAIYFAQTGILYKFLDVSSTFEKEPRGQLSIFQIEKQ